MLFIAKNAFSAERKVDWPSYSVLLDADGKVAGQQNMEFRIASVCASQTGTLIACELTYLKNTKCQDAFVSSNCKLYYECSDSLCTLKIKDAEGVEILDYEDYAGLKERKHKAGTVLKFTFVFDAIPDGVDSFSLMEELGSLWNSVDISLLEGASTRDGQRIGTCPYENVVTDPTFLGGDRNRFSKWVTARLVYPSGASLMGIEGTVRIKISIDESGKATYNIVEGVAPDIDDEALRVVTRAPEWTPGSIFGKPQKWSYIFPCIFSLTGKGVPSKYHSTSPRRF